MKYILFEAGPVTVYSYGLMIALGVILTFVVAQKRAKNYGLDPDAIFYMGCLLYTSFRFTDKDSNFSRISGAI